MFCDKTNNKIDTHSEKHLSIYVILVRLSFLRFTVLIVIFFSGQWIVFSEFKYKLNIISMFKSYVHNDMLAYPRDILY